MWCIRNSNPCRQAEFIRSLHFQIVSGGTWFLALTVEVDSIDSAKSHWHTRYEKNIWGMWVGAVRLALVGPDDKPVLKNEDLRWRRNSKHLCSSMLQDTHSQAQLWEQLNPRKGGVTSEQFDYIDYIQEESWESFKNSKSWIYLFTCFYFSNV